MFSRIRALFSVMGKWERIALLGFTIFALLSGLALVHRFSLEMTELVPAPGGTYIEGSVGKPTPLNPWFTVENDVNRDIVSLVFAGLLKYNPLTKQIEPDLATMKVSDDRLVYTLTLKQNLFWHDSTEADPHRVTADDVVFTYATIQAPDFPNPILHENFRGVTVAKIDDRTVRFTLEKPYSFFPSNLTLGLLPKRAFKDVPPGRTDQAIDFGLAPIGAGPYRLKSIVETDLSTEVTLERFERPAMPPHQLDRIVFRIFPDYATLLSDLRNLDGVRTVARNSNGELIVPKRFQAEQYTLPQYVALFFNLDREALKDQKLRLGLQLGTNKQSLIDAIYEEKIVDTPLLEIDTSDWRYQFDLTAAQGALYESRWFVPERFRLQTLLEHREANDVGPLKFVPVQLLQTGSTLTLTGSYGVVQKDWEVNGVPVTTMETNSGAWMVRLPVGSGASSLRPGDNLLKLSKPDGEVVDSFYLTRAVDSLDFARATQERTLVDLFLQTKEGKLTGESAVTVEKLFLDHGALRRRKESDPVSVRRNERGEVLSLVILTSPAPENYTKVAQMVAEQWLALGVQATVEVPETREEFESRLLRRDYDVLLFGQSLLDNLDSYPYWHSSGVQKVTGRDVDLRRDAYNLSQYTSFKADALLETIRRTANGAERTQALSQLRDVLKSDVPAIFLYSPLYTYAHHPEIQGIQLGLLSMHSDRFLTVSHWFTKQQRVFKQGRGWTSFFGWLGSLL